jgi:EmrB/QacA subfamily drug resistance transporter
VEDKQSRTILIVLFLGVLMGALDIAIIGPALPVIKTTFALNDRNLSWIFSTYVLFNLIGTPLMAKLSDTYGRRSIYILDLTLFGFGSLIVAFSYHLGFAVMLTGRAIQGFGAGGIFPVASAVIGDTFPPERRGRALGLIGAVFGLAFIIGPILGGVVLSITTWEWLFLINLPITVLIILLSWHYLPSTRKEKTGAFDFAGILVLSILLASLSLGINRIDTSQFLQSLTSLQVLLFLLLVLALIPVFLLVERKADNPILPMTLFSRRQLNLAYLLSAGAGIGEASLVFMPLLAVLTFNINESRASYLLLPVVLALSVGSPTVGRLLDRYGSRIVILSGTMVLAAGMFLLSQFSQTMALYIISGVLIGAGLSALLGAPLRYIMLNEVEASERSVAQGTLTLSTSIGQLIGSAGMSAIAASASGSMTGYARAFLVVAILNLILFITANFLNNHHQELVQEKTAESQQQSS